MTKNNIHPVFKHRRKPVIPVSVLTTVVLIVSVVGLTVYFRGKQQSHEIRYYDDVLFQKGIHTQPVTGKRISYAIVTGIIPHHLLASDMLSGYFSLLARQKPKRILLIGPNHDESGNAPVISSRYIWKTPYGTVYPDENILKSLVADGHIHIDERVSEYEHSVGGLTAYMAYYLPGTKIIPLILSGRMQFRDIMDVSQKLSEFMDKDTVLLSSVDFSHYLFSDEAMRKDAVTETLLRNFS